MKTNIVQDTQRILDLIAKRDLDDDGNIWFLEFIIKFLVFCLFHYIEKKQLIDETVDNFNSYINPGFLKYRKSFSSDYVAGKFYFINILFL